MNVNLKKISLFICVFVGCVNLSFSKEINDSTKISGELKKWHKVTLTFNGPESNETKDDNPFLNYRLDVTFSHEFSGKTYVIPGYFAADGDAGETSATSGNKWKVHFAPDETGTWIYVVSFRKGHFAALSYTDKSSNPAGFMDGEKGNFKIGASDKKGKDFRSRGRLQYVGERYLKFAETGEYFLKVGPDAPENFLSYVDFDGTFKDDGHKDDLVKTWAPHLKDWNIGDPTWKNNKGKAIIGSINYLASKNMNVFSFLTFNIEGDDKNVFPFVNYDTWNRYDCSKLDQWEILFEHADKSGMFLHFKLSESENQGLLDNGGIGVNTMLYYREMIARFGHHLALNWNVGEENGEWIKRSPTLPMNTDQRLAAAAYIDKVDAYNHHIVIHNGASFEDLLGPESKFTGVSLQTNKPDFSRVHTEALRWINASKKAGKQWAVAVDEPGDAKHSLLPDAENPKHDNARKNGLWGAFMAGAWGTEWYFGYQHAHSDLTCQDYASRDLFWDQCGYLLDFFEKNELPFWKTENEDAIVSEGDYCLSIPNKLYIVYLKNGKGNIDLVNVKGEYTVRWYNPRTGGSLKKSAVKKIRSGNKIELNNPSTEAKDWVVLLKRN
ncbi:DUF5060 domain-containing protein [Formosa sp. PL04]|uniref:DUF5060 domain-containing protein n=1 Tax=Formosa sp. PL04 TaxID=3081755 RepID=UPI0029816934|nr:DUF5060 domain-containing protein [Formosa sp. PL04]MDW5288105.1 DUF5060 domain-containing protein [Formosa sp. PL04]